MFSNCSVQIVLKVKSPLAKDNHQFVTSEVKRYGYTDCLMWMNIEHHANSNVLNKNENVQKKKQLGQIVKRIDLSQRIYVRCKCNIVL
jgi:hypothetical protein